MITYQDYGRFICSGDPSNGGEQIPKSDKCAAYVQAQAEVVAGTAEIVPHVAAGAELAAQTKARAQAASDAWNRTRARILTRSGQPVQAILLLQSKGMIR